MKNHKFIKLTDCNEIKGLFISIDSIECVFNSMYDHVGMKDKSTKDGYNFIKLKTGTIFEINENPDVISKLIQWNVKVLNVKTNPKTV